MISRATNYLSSLSFSFTKTHQLNLTNATVIVVIFIA